MMLTASKFCVDVTAGVPRNEGLWSRLLQPYIESATALSDYIVRQVKQASRYSYWRASEASETLSGLFNRESRIYILYIYIIVRAIFVLITRKEGGA